MFLNQLLDENIDILEERTDGVTGIGVGGIPFWRIDSWWEKLFQLLSQIEPFIFETAIPHSFLRVMD